MYNNLLSLLAVILLLSAAGTADRSLLAWPLALLCFAAKGLCFHLFARRLFRKIGGSAGYLTAENRLTVLAVLFFAGDLFLLGGGHALHRLPLVDRLPIFAHLLGLGLFFAYQTLIWLAALPHYRRIFDPDPSAASFVRSNLQSSFALILPWLFLSLFFELLHLRPIPGLSQVLASPWGEAGLLFLILIPLLLFMPLLIVRLWNCRPLPAGPLRTEIETFCHDQGIAFADILLWPLLGGRMLTAGVIGLIGRSRYLLLTPALLEALQTDELKAVLAHEIGHVKGKHLPIYLLFLLSLSFLIQLGSTPMLYTLFGSELFGRLVLISGKPPETILTLLATGLLLALVLCYFRFIFGFFMRNFERQADIYALCAMGHDNPIVNDHRAPHLAAIDPAHLQKYASPSRLPQPVAPCDRLFRGYLTSGGIPSDPLPPIIRVFEKIAWLSGKIRDLPNWHHFGIGERVAFLERCRQNPQTIGRHHRKVRLALTLYVVFLLTASLLLSRHQEAPTNFSTNAFLVETLLHDQIQAQPDNPLWLRMLADLHIARGEEQQAIKTYRLALKLTADDPESLNNLAWLLLSAKAAQLRNPQEALALARRASKLKRSPHILDTLATALWANQQLKEALIIEQEALDRAEENRDYYQRQMERFRLETYTLKTSFADFDP